MNSLLYSDVEDALRQTIHSLLADSCPPALPIGMYDRGNDGAAESLWRRLSVDVGLSGLLVAEELGGAGGTPRDAATVLEELGYFAAPVPFLTSSVVATIALHEVDGRGFLRSLASGEKTASLALPLSSMAGTWTSTVRLGADGLEGTITSVAGISKDSLILVPVGTSADASLHVVQSADVLCEPVVALDMTRPLFDLHFRECHSTALGSAGGAIDRALTVGSALLASELLGVARWCLETTVDYLKQRHQFGRALGSFQGLKHRLANLWSRVELTNAAARYAADCVSEGSDDLALAASIAAAYASDTAVLAAEEALQMHAGIGMTWEHPVHVYVKRAKAAQLTFGTSDQHRARIADLTNISLPEQPHGREHATGSRPW